MSKILSRSDFFKREKFLEKTHYKFMGLNSIVCYCTSITEYQLKEALKSKEIKTLNDLKLKTKAGLMCNGCRKDLENLYSLIQKAEDSLLSIPKQRFSDQKKRIKVLDHYPAYWIAQIQKLQTEWNERESFNENFYFEIIDAQIPYISFKLIGELTETKKKLYFEHFYEFIKVKTNFNWIFELH